MMGGRINPGTSQERLVETIAFLSSLVLAAIFFTLFMVDRRARQEDTENNHS